MTDKVSLDNMYEKYTTFDDPIPFWSHSIKEKDRDDNNKLLFFPVMIRDIFNFYKYCGCLLTDHSSVLDKKLSFDDAMKVLSMTCYEYLYYKTFNVSNREDQEYYIYQFSLLLSVCLRTDKFRNIIENEIKDEFISIFNHVDSQGKPAFMINGILYDSDDFDMIKELIAYQNELELPEIERSKEFRDAIELAKKRRAIILGSGDKMGNLEDQLICLSLGYGLPYGEVGKVSLRKFNKMISYMNKKMHYEIYLQASMSGMVEFKDKSVLKHWMTAENDDKYGDLLLDADAINGRIGGNVNSVIAADESQKII